MAAPLTYAAMRRRAFALALRKALRRWGVFALVVALAAGAGSNDPLGAAASLPVLSAWPLLQALQGAPAGLTAAMGWIVVSALAGLVPLALTRRWWWPPRWAEAERALPLAPALLRRSDAQVVRWLVLPWHAVPGLGLVLIAVAGGASGHWLAALAAWGVATAASLALGRAWLARLRRQTTGAAGRDAPRFALRRAAPKVVSLRPWHVWWWLPLRRGAARGSARLLLLFGLANPALAAGSAVAPDASGWWLAALSLSALAGTSLLRARIAVDWRVWQQAAAAWPLSPARMARQARTMAVLPVGAGVMAFALALAVVPAPRPAVACSYAIAVLMGCWLESRPPSPDASHQAARWLLLLAVTVALGSEVRA